MASYVYLIRADSTDCYKIGKTDRHPETRLKELNRQQSAYPLLLEYYVEVPDSAVAENHFHQRYQRYRQHGEWFEMSRSVSAQVVQDFKGYKPGISRGAGKPKPQIEISKKAPPWSQGFNSDNHHHFTDAVGYSPYPVAKVTTAL
jgi:Meiotically up-regulated gene 113